MKKYFIEPDSVSDRFIRPIVKRSNGDGWVGKPFVPFGALQCELNWKALELVEKRLGITLTNDDKITRQTSPEDFVAYVRENSWKQIDEKFKLFGLEDLVGLYSERVTAVNNALEASKNLEAVPGSFKRFCEAYTQMIAHFHMRWRYGKGIDELFKKSIENIPRKYRFQLSKLVPLPECETEIALEKYVELIKSSKQCSDLFSDSDPMKIINNLRGKSPELWEKIHDYSMNHMIVDYEDWRAPVQYTRLIKRISHEVKKDSISSVCREKQDFSNSEVPKEVENPERFLQIVQLTFSQGIQKDNEHHYHIRINNYAHNLLLDFGETAKKENLLNKPYEIFEKSQSEVAALMEKVNGGVKNE